MSFDSFARATPGEDRCAAAEAVLPLLHSPTTTRQRHTPLKARSNISKSISVVYTFSCASPPASLPDYACCSINATLGRNRDVHLITNCSTDVRTLCPSAPRLQKWLKVHALASYETAALRKFRSAYAAAPYRKLQPPQREPWERQNMERFFVLEAFMREQKSKCSVLSAQAVLMADPLASTANPRPTPSLYVVVDSWISWASADASPYAQKTSAHVRVYEHHHVGEPHHGRWSALRAGSA